MNISEKVIDIIKGMEGIGGIPTDEEFMDELDSRLDHLRVKANSVLGDVSESFNEELRGKFFKECTHTRDDNGRTASIIRKIDVAPHDLFEWFKSNVI
jgi:hypothetical protein